MPVLRRTPGRRLLPGGSEATPEHPDRTREPGPGSRRAGAPPATSDVAPRWRPFAGRRRSWAVALVVLAGASALLQVLDAPDLVRQSIAVALAVVLAVGLAVRSGTSVPLASGFALTLGVTAVVTGWEPLLAGAAVGTAVAGSCLAVLGTRPASGPVAVAREVVVALLVAATGGLAAAGFLADLDTERFGYTVLALTLVCAALLVHRPAGGLHLLGRRGLLLLAGALVLLVVVVVYTAALTEYGSPELVTQVRSAQDDLRRALAGVPHPVDFLVGIPALAWGVSLRSRRRQGWWACAFGAATTAHLAADFSGSDWSVGVGLAVVYSLVLGLLVAALLVRLERAVSGHGTPPALREEPPRLYPLE